MSSTAVAENGAGVPLRLIDNGNGEDLSALLNVVQDRRRAASALMETELAALEQRLEAIDAERDALKAEVTAIRRAVSALRIGEHPAEEEAPAPTKKKAAKGWTVTAARKNDVLQRMIEVGKPITPTQLAAGVPGLGVSMAGKAMVELRSEGRIRFVRKVRGGGSQYEPMPEQYDAANAGDDA